MNRLNQDFIVPYSSKQKALFLEALRYKGISQYKFYHRAVDGFEPTIKLLQSRALPLGYTATTYSILS